MRVAALREIRHGWSRSALDADEEFKDTMR
jgi:hypothetical protein